VYLSRGEFVELYTSRLVDGDEIREIISRLETVTAGSKVVVFIYLIIHFDSHWFISFIFYRSSWQ